VALGIPGRKRLCAQRSIGSDGQIGLHAALPITLHRLGSWRELPIEQERDAGLVGKLAATDM
jgi:hypothetical protein